MIPKISKTQFQIIYILIMFLVIGIIAWQAYDYITYVNEFKKEVMLSRDYCLYLSAGLSPFQADTCIRKGDKDCSPILLEEKIRLATKFNFSAADMGFEFHKINSTEMFEKSNITINED